MTFNKEDTCNENSGLEEFIKYDTQKNIVKSRLSEVDFGNKMPVLCGE